MAPTSKKVLPVTLVERVMRSVVSVRPFVCTNTNVWPCLFACALVVALALRRSESRSNVNCKNVCAARISSGVLWALIRGHISRLKLANSDWRRRSSGWDHGDDKLATSDFGDLSRLSSLSATWHVGDLTCYRVWLLKQNYSQRAGSLIIVVATCLLNTCRAMDLILSVQTTGQSKTTVLKTV